MWCSTCQHDVSPPPALGSELIRCLQCGTTLGYERDGGKLLVSETGNESAPAVMPQIPDDDWQIEADLRSVERLLVNLRSTRIDQPAWLTAPHSHTSIAPPVQPAAEQVRLPTVKSSLAAWAVVGLGLAALSCGAVLLGLAQLQARDDLWAIGLPLAIGGQAALIVGLVLQLEGLWHNNRQTVRTLTALDDELSRMRQTPRPLAAK